MSGSSRRRRNKRRKRARSAEEGNKASASTIMTSSVEAMEPMPLAQPVAVVTGASSGIGRAIAIELARRGARLCAIGRNPVTLGETIAASSRAPKALPYQADLTVDENIQRLPRWLEREFGQVDILVHSAGVIHHDPVATATAENFD